MSEAENPNRSSAPQVTVEDVRELMRRLDPALRAADPQPDRAG